MKRPVRRQKRTHKVIRSRKYKKRTHVADTTHIQQHDAKIKLFDKAWHAGKQAQSSRLFASNIRSAWVHFLATLSSESIPWQNYWELLQHFAAGFATTKEAYGRAQSILPTTLSIGVVVSVMNEEQTIQHIVTELLRLQFDEIIFVVNGSTDRTYDIVKQCPNAKIEFYVDPVGHDVGRALGAKRSGTDMVLFLDGDFVIPAEQLLPFIYTIEKGADVALNDIDPYVDSFSRLDQVTRHKLFLNRLLKRRDLGASSLTAVPHALSREAMHTIGMHHLAVPPLAHAIAISKGLNVQKASSVDVIRKNKIRAQNTGPSNPMSNLIIGDHVEALAWLMRQQGSRLMYVDQTRNRSMVENIRSGNR